MLATLLLYIGTFTPSLVALAMTARIDGSDGLRALFDRVLHGDVPARWYVFAVGYLPAVKLTAALVHRVAIGAWPRFGETPWYVIVPAIIFSTPVQAGEEIGWRGYALPRLAARFGVARASVLLGIGWAAWHLPLFFIPGVDHYGQSFPLFVVGVTALSIAMAWLYVHTDGSLLLAMLMHSAVNQTTLLFPSAIAGATNPLTLSGSLVGWLSAAFSWIGAAYLLVRMRRIDSSVPGRRPATDAAIGPALS
jgi:membrane protease YdiL (CAAX protease family)